MPVLSDVATRHEANAPAPPLEDGVERVRQEPPRQESLRQQSPRHPIWPDVPKSVYAPEERAAENQLALFEMESGGGQEEQVPDLESYDAIIVAFSGGKDSSASVCRLLELGADPDKIELWHHDVDGREGEGLMDWPSMPAYCEAFAEAFGLDIYFSWREGGFEREMLREDDRTAPVHFEKPGGAVGTAGGTRGPLGTRRKFPQVSGNLQVRWCSSSLKIDPAATALRNDHRFRGRRTLFVTGERAEESAGRAKYEQFEPHRSDLRNGARYQRHIDHWRPVHTWGEEEVWHILARWCVNPPHPYRLGWGRASCLFCIFGSPRQFASAAQVAPDRAQRIMDYEEEFGCTIKRDRSVKDMTREADPYDMDPELMEAARKDTFNEPIILTPETWTLPAGAYGESCGPT